MNPEEARCLGEIDRRAFLAASGSLAAVSTPALTGCLGEDAGGGPGYRRWLPSSLIPSLQYLDVAALSEFDALWVGEDVELRYGLTLGEVSEMMYQEDVSIFVPRDDVTPEVPGEKLGELGDYDVYETFMSLPGYLATDGSVLVEGGERGDVEAVVEAYEGDRTRLHEEHDGFAATSSRAGDGAAVTAEQQEQDDVTVTAALVSGDEADLTLVSTAGDPQTFAESVGSRGDVSIVDSYSEGSSQIGSELVVVEATAPKEQIPVVLGLE